MSLCVVFRESPSHFGNDLLNLARPDRAKQFGGHKAVVRPVPIPNTAVKHSLANGSGCIASARVGCRQSFKKPEKNFSGFFFSIEVQPGGKCKVESEAYISSLAFSSSAFGSDLAAFAPNCFSFS